MVNDSLPRFTTDKPVIVTAEVGSKQGIHPTDKLPLLVKGSLIILLMTIKLEKPIANKEVDSWLNIFWEFIFIAIL